MVVSALVSMKIDAGGLILGKIVFLLENQKGIANLLTTCGTDTKIDANM